MFAEMVAATAATEMIAPEVAAMASMPGMCATCSGISSASPRSMNCATSSMIMIRTKLG